MQYIFLVILIVLQILDIYTTKKILNNGGYEANPVMNYLMEKMGVSKALYISKALAIGLLVFFTYNYGITSLYMLFPLTIFYVFVINNNFKVIKQLDK